VTSADTSVYNIDPTQDPQHYDATRAGRTIGEIIADVLTFDDNATLLDGLGIGNYTSLSPPTLPTVTTDDLDALTVIPPYPVYVQGEKLLGAIEQVLTNVYPNYVMEIQPDGTIRFTNLRACTNHVLTLDGDDLIEPTEIARDCSNNYSRVVVRGQPQIESVVVTLSEGTLQEDFAWGSYTNAQAKTNWSVSDYNEAGSSQDAGSCTCNSTLSVTVDSDSSTANWTADELDQTSTGRHATLYLYDTIGTGITQFVGRPVTANTALTAGGTSDLTLAYALPVTSYDRYRLYLQTSPANQVWRKYKVANTDVGAALVNYFPYPQAFAYSASQITSVTSPTATICYSTSGSPPYTEVPLSFTVDPSTGTILFTKPTSLVFGGGTDVTPPSDVRAILAVAVGKLRAIYPADVSGVAQYQGTFNTVEGGERTLFVTVNDWVDPVNQTQMDAYAQAVLESVQDTVCSGNVVAWDLLSYARVAGASVTIEGNGFSTGWESFSDDVAHPGLPIRSVSLTWDSGQIRTELSCHNHYAAFSSALFMPPARQFQPLGGEFGSTFSAFTQEGMGQNYGEYGLSMPTVGGGNALATQLAQMPRYDNIPTNPGDYLKSIGAPTSVSDLGLPTSMDDLGLATNPTDYLKSIGAYFEPLGPAGGIRDSASDPNHLQARLDPNFDPSKNTNALEQRHQDTIDRKTTKKGKTKAFYDRQKAKQAAKEARQQAKEAREVAKNKAAAERVRQLPDTTLEREDDQ
jgi:hypothetical protein